MKRGDDNAEDPDKSEGGPDNYAEFCPKEKKVDS